MIKQMGVILFSIGSGEGRDPKEKLGFGAIMAIVLMNLYGVGT